MPESPPAIAKPLVPTLSELFFGFLAIAATGFGGLLPWAQIVLVEKRRWLTGEQFAADLALSQFLPGPNIMNLSILIGSRFHGAVGALYPHYSDVSWLRGGLAGLSAAAVGLLISMAGKLVLPLLHRRRIPSLAFALIAFLSGALVR